MFSIASEILCLEFSHRLDLVQERLQSIVVDFDQAGKEKVKVRQGIKSAIATKWYYTPWNDTFRFLCVNGAQIRNLGGLELRQGRFSTECPAQREHLSLDTSWKFPYAK